MTETLSAKKTNDSSLTDDLANSHITEKANAGIDNGDSNTATTTAESDKEASTTISEEDNGASPNGAQQVCGNNHNLPFCSLEKRDNYYVLPKCELPPRKRFAPVEAFVANAVKARLELEGDSDALKAYKAVMDAIRRKRDLAMLEQIFLALRTAGNGSTLHQLSGNPTKHAQLLHFLLRFDPFSGTPIQKHAGEIIPEKAKANAKSGEDEKDPASAYSLADAYFHLILSLVSANSVFLVPTMTSLWKLLTVLPTTKGPPEPRIQRIHATLAAMTRLVPKGKTEIFPIMSANFPFRSKPEEELIWCYRQCFAVVEYVPFIYSQVLQFVIDKCLEMDVEIKIHDGGEVTLDDEEDDDCIFELELEDATPKAQKGDLSVDEMADKLDALMLITFELLEQNGSHDVGEARKLYERCLPAFESSILITHRSKFVQFILFYLCGLESKAVANAASDDPKLNQQHATLYREFAANLIEIIFDPYRATLVRQKAACYLASFASRASFVEADTVCESLCALLQWADAYIASLVTNSISAADARNQCDLHSLFYTICQAAYYIMCFRGTEAVRFYRYIAQMKSEQIEALPVHLQDVELDQIDICPARWNRVCSHGLQPLRYCLETVREEFLSIAKVFGLLDDGLLQRLYAEHNQRSSGRRKKKASSIMTSTTLESARRQGGVGGLGQGSNPLDSFFPFDPYLLRLSHPYIQPYYRNWSDQGDDDSVDMVEEDDEEEDDEMVASTARSDGTTSDEDSSSSDGEEYERAAGSYDDTAMASSTPPRSPSAIAAPRQPWTETLRRERAASIENGSW